MPDLDESVAEGDSGHLAAHDALADLYNKIAGSDSAGGVALLTALLNGTYAPTDGDTIVIPAELFVGVFNGAAAGSIGLVWATRDYGSGADRRNATMVKFPSWWATYHVDLLWANKAATGGNVAWRFEQVAAGDGDSLAASPTAINVVTAAGAQNTAELTRLASDLAVPASPKVAHLGLLRMTASDTLSGTASAIAVILTRAS